MLDRANSGPEPSAEILRAIRHGVAAGACSVAARETRDPKWWRLAQEQREKARGALHQAAPAFLATGRYTSGRSADRET